MNDTNKHREVPQQFRAKSASGTTMATVLLVLIAVTIAFGVVGQAALAVLFAFIAVLAAMVILPGFYTVQPNMSAVLTLFGAYRGSDDRPGLRWANPLYGSQRISLRIRNFMTTTSKVNDARGNPIEIAAVVVWRVHDTARAAFGVDRFVNYVHTQAESAVRHIAREYPYDSYGHHDAITLTGSADDVAHRLAQELQERVNDAGVEIIEARITDLSYAPEVAENMLKRQQAEALVAARTKIVEGATAMVRDAVAQLAEPSGHDDAIPMDADQRIAFASNLMTMIVDEGPVSSRRRTTSSSRPKKHPTPTISHDDTDSSGSHLGHFIETMIDAAP